MTNKSVDGLHGSTVWLISGEGSPKKYYLEFSFVVDEVGDVPDKDADFRHYAKGTQGRKLDPRIPLGQYAWFQELRAQLADFAAGLSEIGLHTVAELERLVAAQDAG